MKNTSEERVEHISGLVVRSLKVTNGRNKCQEFTQYHYTNWPESLDSDNLNLLIELVDLAKQVGVAAWLECWLSHLGVAGSSPGRDNL